VLSPAPIVLIDLKLDTDQESRTEMAVADFALGHEVCRLLETRRSWKTARSRVAEFEPEFRGGWCSNPAD
jgi:hypothetical protein